LDGIKSLFGIALVLIFSGTVFAQGFPICPGANLTDDVRGQIVQARADNDMAALKTLMDEYCPATEGMPPRGFGPKARFARPDVLCPNGNITDDVREQFAQAVADKDFETVKSLREEYCPFPEKPEDGAGREAAGRAGGIIALMDEIRDSISSGDYATALSSLEDLRSAFESFKGSGHAFGPRGFGRSPVPGPGGCMMNSSVVS